MAIIDSKSYEKCDSLEVMRCVVALQWLSSFIVLEQPLMAESTKQET